MPIHIVRIGEVWICTSSVAILAQVCLCARLYAFISFAWVCDRVLLLRSLRAGCRLSGLLLNRSITTALPQAASSRPRASGPMTRQALAQARATGGVMAANTWRHVANLLQWMRPPATTVSAAGRFSVLNFRFCDFVGFFPFRFRFHADARGRAGHRTHTGHRTSARTNLVFAFSATAPQSSIRHGTSP